MRKGFTLVELLVVIAIIAVLAGMLLPALDSARQSARCGACLSNVRQIGLGLQMYTSDNDGALPNFSDGPGSAGASNDPRRFTNQWYEALEPYVVQAGDYTGNSSATGAPMTKDPALGVWQCLGAGDQERRKAVANWGGGYGANQGVIRFVTDGGSLRLGQIRRPSALAVLGDAGRPTGQGVCRYTTWMQWSGVSTTGFKPLTSSGSGTQQIAARHRDKGNFAGADGHAETWAYAKISDPENAGYFFHKLH